MRQSALKRFAQRNIITTQGYKSPSPQEFPRKKSSIMTVKNSKTMPAQQDTISRSSKEASRHYYESRFRASSLPTNLPRLEEQIAIQEKKTLQNICAQRPRKKMKYDLMPLKKPEPIRLMKRSSSSNSGVSYLSMASSRRKPTDQLFSQMENIKLVERLLLARPTKQNTKSEHQMFYKQQNKYKKNIQLSKSVPFKSKKVFNNSRPWINS